MRDDRYKFVFSRNFEYWLKKKNVMNITLAEQTGISANIISGYRSGRVQPTAPQIIKIAEALKISPGELLGQNNQVTNEKELSDGIIRNINEALKDFRLTFKQALAEEDN